MALVVINDDNWRDHVDPAVVNGEYKSKGLIPRNYDIHPPGCYKSAPPLTALDFPLIPRSEWVERIEEMERTKSRLSDIRRIGNFGKPIPALDQDGVGYCWNHSVTGAVILSRAVMGLPYVRLSAFFIGCLIKNYRDEGGWGALALDFVTEKGVPDVKFWPEKSMQKSNDNAECRANALLHKVTEGFADLASPQWSRNLSEDQAMTLLLCRFPVISDFNWWSHSVCAIDPIITTKGKANRKGLMSTDFESLDLHNPKDLEVYGAAFGKKILNSWTDQWGDMGEGNLEGTKAILDGGCAPRMTLVTAA